MGRWDAGWQTVRRRAPFHLYCAALVLQGPCGKTTLCLVDGGCIVLTPQHPLLQGGPKLAADTWDVGGFSLDPPEEEGAGPSGQVFQPARLALSSLHTWVARSQHAAGFP